MIFKDFTKIGRFWEVDFGQISWKTVKTISGGFIEVGFFRFLSIFEGSKGVFSVNLSIFIDFLKS